MSCSINDKPFLTNLDNARSAMIRDGIITEGDNILNNTAFLERASEIQRVYQRNVGDEQLITQSNGVAKFNSALFALTDQGNKIFYGKSNVFIPTEFDVLINSDFSKRENVTARELLGKIATESKSVFYKGLAHNLINYIPTELKVYNSALPTKVLGSYKYQSERGKITAESIILDSAKNGYSERTFLHEVMHAATIKIMIRPNSQLTGDQVQAINNLNRLYEKVQLKLSAERKKAYGLTDVYEFVAEAFSNPEFQDELMRIKIDRKRTLKSAFTRFIAKLLGIKTNFGRADETDSALLYALEDVITLLKEESKNKNVQYLDANITFKLDNEDEEDDEFNEYVAEQQKAFERTLANSDKLKLKEVEGKQDDFYTLDDQQVMRVGPVLEGMFYRSGKTKTRKEYYLDKEWPEGSNRTLTKKTELFPDKLLTYEQFAAEFDRSEKVTLITGKLKEAKILAGQTNDQKYLDLVKQYTEELQGMDEIVKVDFMDNIIADLGLLMNIPRDSKNGEPIGTHNFASGVKTFSKKLGIGGTSDIMINHSDGTNTLVEVKTGRNFIYSRSGVVVGEGIGQYSVFRTFQDQAKMQAMTYAVLARVQNPTMKFKDVMVLYVPDAVNYKKYDIPVETFLYELKAFFANPNKMKELGLPENALELLEKEFEENGGKKGDLFKAHNYRSGLNSNEYNISRANADTKVEDLLDEIQFVSNRASITQSGKVEASIRLKQKLKNLSTDLAQLLLDDPIQNSNITDISIMARWFNQLEDFGTDDPQIRTFELLFKNAQINIQDEVATKSLIINALFQKTNTNLRYITSPKETFSKFFTKRKKISEGGELFETNEYRLLHANESIDSEEYRRWNALTQEDRNLLTMLNETFKSYVSEDGFFANNIVHRRILKGKVQDLSSLDYHNSVNRGDSFEWYDGWIPKYVVSSDLEYAQNAGNGFFDVTAVTSVSQVKSIWDSIKKKFKNWFTNSVNNTSVNGSLMIPFNCFGSSYTIQNDPDIYSLNLLDITQKFLTEMERKKQLDPVLAYARAISLSFELGDINEAGVITNTQLRKAAWLNDWVTANIIKPPVDLQLTAKSLRVGAGSYYESRQLNSEELLQGINKWSSRAILGFRPFSVLGQAAQSTVMNYRNASVGSMLEALGVDDSYLDYTLSDKVKANGLYVDLMKDLVAGDLTKNKLFLLAAQTGYLVSFDAKNKAEKLNIIKSKNISKIYNDSYFAMMNMQEEAIAYNVLAANMYNIKHKEKSIYDWYEVFEMDRDGNIADTPENRSKVNSEMVVEFSTLPGIGAYKAFWTGGVRYKQQIGTGPTTRTVDINGLTTEEISSFEFSYNRIQGEYRNKFAFESHAIGTFFVLFKRYIPRIMKNAFGSKRSLYDLGAFEEVAEYNKIGEDTDGVKTVRWRAREFEGRYRMLMKSPLLLLSSPGTKAFNDATPSQKRTILELYASVLSFAMLYGLYAVLFADSDDDDQLKKFWRMYLLENVSQEINPYEYIKLANEATVPVGAKKILDTAEGFGDLFMASIALSTGNQEAAYNTKGELKGFKRSIKGIPQAAWAFDLLERMHKIEIDQEDLLEVNVYKLK